MLSLINHNHKFCVWVYSQGKVNLALNNIIRLRTPGAAILQEAKNLESGGSKPAPMSALGSSFLRHCECIDTVS